MVEQLVEVPALSLSLLQQRIAEQIVDNPVPRGRGGSGGGGKLAEGSERKSAGSITGVHTAEPQHMEIRTTQRAIQSQGVSYVGSAAPAV